MGPTGNFRTRARPQQFGDSSCYRAVHGGATGWTSSCKLLDMSGNLISCASYPKHCCIQSHERQFWSLGNGRDSLEELRPSLGPLES
ncbi:hypothetical protein U0070_010802 [Myodes glareolus]|uniref:Uncharacterized protein n=1 Tax=Myodes glareolus TaxID=447135 RepID=A0AAW0GZ58_MYOGA